MKRRKVPQIPGCTGLVLLRLRLFWCRTPVFVKRLRVTEKEKLYIPTLQPN